MSEFRIDGPGIYQLRNGRLLRVLIVQEGAGPSGFEPVLGVHCDRKPEWEPEWWRRDGKWDRYGMKSEWDIVRQVRAAETIERDGKTFVEQLELPKEDA